MYVCMCIGDNGVVKRQLKLLKLHFIICFAFQRFTRGFFRPAPSVLHKFIFVCLFLDASVCVPVCLRVCVCLCHADQTYRILHEYPQCFAQIFALATVCYVKRYVMGSLEPCPYLYTHTYKHSCVAECLKR